MGPTSYIPTTTGTVTRAADLMSISGTDFTDFYNQTEGTVVVEAEVSTLNATLAMMSISDGTNNEAINIYFNTSVAETFLQVRDASVTQASIGGATTPEGYYTIAGAYKADDFAVSIGGGVVSVDSSGNLPVVDRLKVGTLATGGTSISGHVKRLTYYPRSFSAPTLETLSS